MRQFIQNNSRRMTLLSLATALIGGLGCATAITGSNLSKTTWKEGDVVLNETILALGKPDENFAKQIANPNAVAFLGKNNTYLLVEGGARLMAFAQQLDSKRLSLVADSKALYLRDKAVWGTLRFTYSAPVGEVLTVEEKQTLAKLNFTAQSSGMYATSVSVKGAVYPAVSLASSGLAQLHQSRDLVFHAPPTTETTPNLGSIALLPVAIVVDVVTAPLQFLGFGVLAISLGRH